MCLNKKRNLAKVLIVYGLHLYIPYDGIYAFLKPMLGNPQYLC